MSEFIFYFCLLAVTCKYCEVSYLLSRFYNFVLFRVKRFKRHNANGGNEVDIFCPSIEDINKRYEVFSEELYSDEENEYIEEGEEEYERYEYS